MWAATPPIAVAIQPPSLRGATAGVRRSITRYEATRDAMPQAFRNTCTFADAV